MNNESGIKGLEDLLLSIWEKGISRFEPSFEPKAGFTYKNLEGYPIEEQVRILEGLQKMGLVTSEQFDSTLKCGACNSLRFSLRSSCTLCKSSNIVRGSVIEHLACGNIDFDEAYLSKDNTLVCAKCGKRLKALGVDYSKPGFFYKCMDCKALLPSMETRCTCFDCGKSFSQDELHNMQLPVYSVNTQELSQFIDGRLAEAMYSNYLVPVSEELNKMGFNSVSPGTVEGLSRIQHTFDLVVYNGKNEPVLVADVMKAKKQKKNDNGKNKQSEELTVLAFYAKCMDLYFLTKKTINRIFLTASELKENAKKLADAYGITVVIAADLSNKEQIVTKIVNILGE